MRVGFISDLHYDVNVYLKGNKGNRTTVYNMVEETKKYIEQQELDYLLISGDIMNGLEAVNVVKELNQSSVEVRYVVGNHDLWSRMGNTTDIYDEYLEDRNCLVNKVEELKEDLVVVGMCSWYDGSLGTMDESGGEFRRLKKGWADNQYTTWADKREEIVNKRMEEIKEVLEGVKDKKVILLNHFVPHKDFIVHKEGNVGWNIGNSYMGTSRMNDLIEKYPNIKYVTFGHTHKIFGEVSKGVTYLSTPLGYVNEWVGKPFRERLEDVMIIKEF